MYYVTHVSVSLKINIGCNCGFGVFLELITPITPLSQNLK